MGEHMKYVNCESILLLILKTKQTTNKEKVVFSY